MARIIKREKKTVPLATGKTIRFERKTRVDNETGQFSMTVPDHIAPLFSTPVEVPNTREPVTHTLQVHRHTTRGRDKPNEYVIRGNDLESLKRRWDLLIGYFVDQNVETRFVILIHFSGTLVVDPEWSDETQRRVRAMGLRGHFYGGSGSENKLALGYELAQEQTLPDGKPAYFKATLNDDGEPVAQKRKVGPGYSYHAITFTQERWKLLEYVRAQLRALILVMGEHFGKDAEPEKIERFLDEGRLLAPFKDDTPSSHPPRIFTPHTHTHQHGGTP